MTHKKWQDRILGFLQVAVAAGIAAAALFLLYRYAKYGQREKEASGRVAAVQEESGDEMTQGGGKTEKRGLMQEGGAQDKDAEREEIGEEDQQETWDDFQVPEMIRVRILDQDFLHDCHKSVTVSCSSGYTVTELSENAFEVSGRMDTDESGRAELGTEVPEKEETENSTEHNGAEKAEDTRSRTYSPEEVLEIDAGELQENEILCVEGADGASLCIASLQRGDGVPEYDGKLYLMGEDEGIAVINELPLEEYLYSVISSEMPSDYPAESLKAQAVCARTYAVNCINSKKSEEKYEDLDDSVSFQVYNNYHYSDSSKDAVDETRGEILPLKEVQYYSTSCLSEHREDLDSDAAFEKFLSKEPEEGAQYGSPWLRWSVKLSLDDVLENLRTKYGGKAAESGENSQELSTITDIKVDGRRGDGQVQALTVICGDESFHIEGEYNIRKILGNMQAEITLLDGSVTSKMQLLPSAFFCLEITEGYINVRGGGYGHGNGMSQCGAAEMADLGLDYKAILEYYYDVSVVGDSEE